MRGRAALARRRARQGKKQSRVSGLRCHSLVQLVNLAKLLGDGARSLSQQVHLRLLHMQSKKEGDRWSENGSVARSSRPWKGGI